MNFVVEERDGDVICHYFNANINARYLPMTAKIVITGRHADTVVKVDGRWRIARQDGQFDQQFELNW